MTKPPNRKRQSLNSPQHLEAKARREARGGRPPLAKTPKAPPRFIPKITDEDRRSLEDMLIYQDEMIMAFHKPSGLSSQGGRGGGHNLDDRLWAYAKSNGKRPQLIHRLDRDTSGLILAGRTHPAISSLGKAMIQRQFHKTYLCLVAQHENLEDEGVIDHPLRREEIGREAYSQICTLEDEGAQEAYTAYRVLARQEDAALVQCHPKTGRMHQIRVHLAHKGAAIAGDVRYGGALSLGGLMVGRLMLHASRLEFPHPASQAKMTLDCPLAVDMARLIEALGLEPKA